MKSILDSIHGIKIGAVTQLALRGIVFDLTTLLLATDPAAPDVEAGFRIDAKEFSLYCDRTKSDDEAFQIRFVPAHGDGLKTKNFAADEFDEAVTYLFSLCPELANPKKTPAEIIEMHSVFKTGNPPTIKDAADERIVALEEYIELEKSKDYHAEYFKKLKAAAEKVEGFLGVAGHFQTADGTVWLVDNKNGRWVDFDRIEVRRTRRPGEKAGTLTLQDAAALGYEVKDADGKIVKAKAPKAEGFPK